MYAPSGTASAISTIPNRTICAIPAPVIAASPGETARPASSRPSRARGCRRSSTWPSWSHPIEDADHPQRSCGEREDEEYEQDIEHGCLLEPGRDAGGDGVLGAPIGDRCTVGIEGDVAAEERVIGGVIVASFETQGQAGRRPVLERGRAGRDPVDGPEDPRVRVVGERVAAYRDEHGVRDRVPRVERTGEPPRIGVETGIGMRADREVRG